MKTFCQKVFAKRFHFAHNSNHVSHGAIHLIIISPHGAGMLFAVLVRASRLSVSSRARAIIALSFAEPTRTVAAERVQAQVDCCKRLCFRLFYQQLVSQLVSFCRMDCCEHSRALVSPWDMELQADVGSRWCVLSLPLLLLAHCLGSVLPNSVNPSLGTIPHLGTLADSSVVHSSTEFEAH